MFGADVNEGFGLDWANYRLARPGVQGVVNPDSPRPERENINGHIREDAQPLIGPTEEYQDPSISSRGSWTSEGTDQRPTSVGHDVTPADKPVTLNHQIRKSLESSRPKGTTIADQIAKEMKNEPYDFLT
jgi:hypothetical protein